MSVRQEVWGGHIFRMDKNEKTQSTILYIPSIDKLNRESHYLFVPKNHYSLIRVQYEWFGAAKKWIEIKGKMIHFSLIESAPYEKLSRYAFTTDWTVSSTVIEFSKMIEMMREAVSKQM